MQIFLTLEKVQSNIEQLDILLMLLLPICRVAPSWTRLSAMSLPILFSDSDVGGTCSSGSGWVTWTMASRWDMCITPSPKVRGWFGLTCATNGWTNNNDDNLVNN
jgi:hypothetical protein